jgi:hypothetical protein
MREVKCLLTFVKEFRMDCKYYKEESGLSASALHPSPEGLGFPRGIDKHHTLYMAKMHKNKK